jgi:hypothetical protein
MGMRLERLRIRTYLDEEFKQPEGDDFVVWMNPQSYQRTLGIKTTEAKEIGGKGSSPSFMKIDQETLSFKLVFDTTGLIPSPLGSDEMPANGVVDILEPLIDKIAKVSPKTKRPNFVQLSWAQLQARCLLSSMTVEYKLFRPDGTPIRADANLSFTAFTSALSLSRQAKAITTETTQIVTLVEGDTLPALCARIYGKSEYYLEVARYNQIYSFRRLKTGTQIMFPPRGQLS